MPEPHVSQRTVNTTPRLVPVRAAKRYEHEEKRVDSRNQAAPEEAHPRIYLVFYAVRHFELLFSRTKMLVESMSHL